MLDEYMDSIGFNSSEISFIKSSYFQPMYSENSLLYNLKKLVDYFHRNHLKNDDIIFVIKSIPEVISMSLENIKSRVFELTTIGFSKYQVFNIIKSYPYIINLSHQKIINKITFFSTIGFDNNEIINLLSDNPYLFTTDNSTIKNKVDYFLEIGYRPSNITYLFNNATKLFNTNLKTIKSKYNYMKELGFKDEDIINISLNIPSIYLDDKNIIKDNFSFLENYGFNIKGIIKIINKIPYLLNNQYLEKLSNKIDLLIEFGFSRNEITNIIKNNPYYLLLSEELIINNYKSLIKFGLSNYLISNTPLLINYNSSEISKRIKFYKDNNLFNIILDNPSYLLFSYSFIKMRYKFLINNNCKLDDLFIDDISFYNKYHVTREDLVKGE